MGRHLQAINRKEKAKITLQDALYLLQQAWCSVTQQTIIKCYAWATFKSANKVALLESDSDDDDSLDDLLLATLIVSNVHVSMDDSFTIDDNSLTCDNVTDDSIIEDIISLRQSTTDVCDDDDKQHNDQGSLLQLNH